MKAVSLTFQKLWPMLRFFADKWTNTQTDIQMDKQTGQKLYAPNLSMWGHKKH